MSNLYGNPHSASDPAKLSGKVVDETREKTLRFFGADPEHFDLVFVANATAAIKLVQESFKDLGNTIAAADGEEGGFRYFYHVDCHNSVVGVRESADPDYHCFRNNAEVEEWLSGSSDPNQSSKLGLFAYPGQSNMTGRRLPLSWTGRLRASNHPAHQDTYSLLDAAALATTSPLNQIFSDPNTAPDFTSVSFYKIFGYPDLGALIVRKASGNILRWGRKYFGGGTVSLVTVLGNKPWFENKEVLHESLEDGTLPFHNIIALNAAIDTHERLYGPDPMTTISKHCTFLGKYLYDEMSSLVHSTTGAPVCKIYKGVESAYGDSTTQGATIAFNIQLSNGEYVPYTSVVETLANERKIFVRAGQLCNPGGIASHLNFNIWHIKRLWSNGHRCGQAHLTGTEIVNGKPTGVVRVSLGAMTTLANVDAFITFLREEFMVAPVAELQSVQSSVNNVEGYAIQTFARESLRLTPFQPPLAPSFRSASAQPSTPHSQHRWGSDSTEVSTFALAVEETALPVKITQQISSKPTYIPTIENIEGVAQRKGLKELWRYKGSKHLRSVKAVA
jgi:molybdenum cofactor sulfurtransferase